MTGSLRRSSITSKPRSHPATEGPASSREGDSGSGAVGWALLYRGWSRGLLRDARSGRRWAHRGCLLPTSGRGWQPATALEQSPQRRLWCRSGAYRGSAAARSPFTGGRAGFRHHLLKAFGVGLPLAVLLDATLIRGALLPAAMRLGGRATWWAPGPLHWLHARSGLCEPTEHTRAPGPCAVRIGPSRRPGQRTMARRAAFGWLGRRRRLGQGTRHELGGHGGSTGRPGHNGGET
jgi:transposase InsO family protein